MSMSPRHRSVLVIGAGVVAVAALAAGAVATRRGPIETDLTRRATSALAQAGLGRVDVSFEGRDATLGGVVASEADRLTAPRIIAQLEGVRTVDGIVGVAAPSAVSSTTTTTQTPPATTTAPATTSATADAPVEASFTLSPFHGGVRLDGVVPTTDLAAAITGAATDTFGDGRVDASLVVEASASDPMWLHGLSEVISALGGVAEPSLTVLPPDAIVGGLIAAEGSRSRIIEAVGALGLTVEDQLVVDAAPDPAEAAALESALNSAVTDTSILFASGSSELSTEGRSLLDSLFPLIVATPGARIEVAGHTDDVGAPQGNLELSQARADAVAAYLIGKGVDPAQLTSVGYGEAQPIADNETEDGRAINRRIEFRVEGAS